MRATSSGQAESLADLEVHPGDLHRVALVAGGGLDHAEDHVRRRAHRHPGRQVLGDSLGRPARRGAPRTPRARGRPSARAARPSPSPRPPRRCPPPTRCRRRSGGCSAASATRARPGSGSPAACGSAPRRRAGCRRRRSAPAAGRRRRSPGPRSCARASSAALDAGLPRQPVEVGDAGVVDQLVDDLGDHDLAAQRVLLHLAAVALAHLRREVGEQLGAEERVLGQVAAEQVVGEHDLGPRHQHRQLGRGQPLLALEPARHLAPASAAPPARG